MLDDLEEILVGVVADERGALDERARACLDVAIGLASRRTLRTVVLLRAPLHVRPPEPPGGRAESLDRHPLIAYAAQQIRELGSACELRLTHGSLPDAVLEVSEREEIDAVVVGRFDDVQEWRDAPGFHFVHSGACTILRRCSCPVWVTHPGISPLPKVILAATDLEPAGDCALEIAADLARDLAAELHVVHAFGLTPSAQLSGEEAEFESALRARAEASIRERVESTGPFEGLRLHIGVDAPSRLIVRAAAATHADLLVLGNVARRGLPGAVLGNTAERLLARLDMPLLVVRPDGAGAPALVQAEDLDEPPTAAVR